METVGTVDAHGLDVGETAAALGVDPSVGLEPVEAARRAGDLGPNELERHAPTAIWRLLLDAATEPFVLLLATAAVGAILLGEVRDGFLIFVGLVPIVGADVATEFRGERALEALRSASAPGARVRRGGLVEDVAAATLVPGDIVLLRTGDVIPADLRISSADRLLIDRSLLTGESVPEPATIAPDPVGAALPDRRSIGYAGTSVVGGRGEGIVVAIGRSTELGRIAGSVAERRRRRSPVQFELDRLVRILLVVALALIGIVTALGFLRGRSLGENLLAGISAAIAAIPEEPPILLAVVLGLGAYRLLKRGVLVRRLNAEEVLGAIDLILMDKTGTLTQNRLEVAMVADPDGEISNPDRRREILLAALRAEEDAWARSTGTPPGSFTQALERAVEAGGGSTVLDPADLISAEPVTDLTRRTRIVCRRDGGIECLAIGAPEAVLELVDSEPVASAWRIRAEDAAGRGIRVVGLARGDLGGSWEMVALVGFADPPRAGVDEALGEAVGAGIQTVVVTGDHPATARSIAAAVGIPAERIVIGDEVDAWSDDQLRRELPALHVVARSVPEQKDRIVRVAREAGRIVAVTGDGVNDAPALHRADVAVAMGSGTAVAREAADLVLGDDSFVTLMYGLREGRRIVDNVQKGLVFLVSTHVAFLGFILIATLAGFDQPLLPIQILWMELFIDVSASFSFEREPAEPDVMRRPPRRRGEPLLPWSLLLRLGLAGAFSAVAALWVLQNVGGTMAHAAWVAYTTLVAAQVVRAYANRSLRVPMVRLAPNALLVAGVLLVLAIQAAIPFIPGIAEAFRASPLDVGEWLVVATIAVAPAVVAELVRATRHATWVA